MANESGDYDATVVDTKDETVVDGTDFVAAKELESAAAMARVYADADADFILYVYDSSVQAGVGDAYRDVLAVLVLALNDVA